MEKQRVIYYLRWKDDTYSVFFVGDADPIFKDLSYECFKVVVECFPNAKFVDVTTIKLD